MADVVTLGETMALWRTDQPGLPVNGSRGTLGFGGADSNVAIALSRLGHTSKWISALGDDELGAMIASGIESEGVETSVQFSKSHPTGLMVKSPSKSKERFVSFYRSGSAASSMGPADIAEADFEGAKIFHFSGITPMLSSSCAELMRKVIDTCKSSGAAISFDVNHRPALWDGQTARATYKEFCGKSDLVFGDREELSLLVGEDLADLELLSRVAELGPTNVVLKLGDEGAMSLCDGEVLARPAINIEVIDTVGAGDAFVAGYLSALLDDEPADERLIRATYCGAQACTNPGDWEGSVTRDQLDVARGELVS